LLDMGRPSGSCAVPGGELCSSRPNLHRIKQSAERSRGNLRQARKHEPRIGRFIHVDGTAWQTHAALEHCCTDRAACRAARKKAAMHLERLGDKELQDERHAEAELTVEEALESESMPTFVGEDETYRYFMLGGHLFRTRDKTCAPRMYGGKSGKKKKKFWHGGIALPAIDDFTGAPLAIEQLPANRLEHQAYERLLSGVIEAVGEPPLGMTGDRAHSIKEVFELNTRQGIASVIPWRKWKAFMEREEVRCDAFDEHGVPRCQHCGGPGDQVGPGLGLYFACGEPRIRFRCLLRNTDACKSAQSIACEREWRMLLPLSRTTELYHALKSAHKNREHVHGHWRERFSCAGKDLAGRLRRTGVQAQWIRSEAALAIEWFRLGLRHGWLGSPRRTRHGELVRTSGAKKLETLLKARRKRRLNRPYGQAAIKLGLARAGPAP
jgi:hypothetical protein